MLPMLRNRFATPTLFESTFEPWSDLRREIDRLFDSVMSGMRPIGFDDDTRIARWVPPMDVEEQDDTIRLSFEVPGVNPDDVHVSVANGVLTLELPKAAESRRRKIEIGRGTGTAEQKKLDSGDKGGRKVA